MKVKIFSNDGNAPEMEIEINKWLSDKNIIIKHIKQGNVIDKDIISTVISVWYEDKLL